MKRFHPLITATALVIATAVSAFGQTAGPAGGAPSRPATEVRHHGNMLAADREIFGKLSLTSSQKAQVKELVTKFAEQAKALHQERKATADKSALKAKHKALREEYLKSLSGILTPAQFEQYKALHKEYFQKMHAKQSGGNPPRR